MTGPTSRGCPAAGTRGSQHAPLQRRATPTRRTPPSPVSAPRHDPRNAGRGAGTTDAAVRFLPSDPQETPVRGVQPSARFPKSGGVFCARTLRGGIMPAGRRKTGVLMHSMRAVCRGAPGRSSPRGSSGRRCSPGAWTLSESSHGSHASSAFGLAPGQSVAVDASAAARPAPRSHPAVVGVAPVPALPALRRPKPASRPAARVAVAREHAGPQCGDRTIAAGHAVQGAGQHGHAYRHPPHPTDSPNSDRRSDNTHPERHRHRQRRGLICRAAVGGDVVAGSQLTT